MIKISTIILTASILAVTMVGIPKFTSLYSGVKYVQAVETQRKQVQEQLASVTPQLAAMQEKYSNLHLSTNREIAETVNGFSGCSLDTISSLLNRNGALFECSEVAGVADVEFFSDTIEQMCFKLSISDLNMFMNSLKKSALAVNKLDVTGKKALLYINTVFCADGEGGGEE